MVVPKEEGRPVIWAFSGMTQQWPQMGKALMEVPVFKESIERYHSILQKKDKDFDLLHILTTEDPTIFDYIINPFVAITAFQLAVTNILKSLGLKPDIIIGHSLGEVACGYADGCLTEEQALLAAYYRGLVTRDGDVKGLMAVVFMGAKELDPLLPEGVENGCHNSSNCCTITGNTESVEKFLLTLDENIRSKVMKSSTIPYHSSLIRPLAAKLAEYLEEVIPEPKERSKNWYCSSALPENWDKEEVRICGPKFFANNYAGTVYFEELFEQLPKRNLLVDMSPSGIFSMVVDENLGECVPISIAKKYDLDGMNIFVTKLKE